MSRGLAVLCLLPLSHWRSSNKQLRWNFEAGAEAQRSELACHQPRDFRVVQKVGSLCLFFLVCLGKGLQQRCPYDFPFLCL